MASSSRLPKCIYARGYGASQTFFVSVTTDGLRENLGTFLTLDAAEKALKQHRIKLLFAQDSSIPSINNANNAHAVVASVIADSYTPEQLALWNELLSYQEPTSLSDVVGSLVVRDDNDELVTIPEIVVSEFSRKQWDLPIADKQPSQPDSTIK